MFQAGLKYQKKYMINVFYYTHKDACILQGLIQIYDDGDGYDYDYVDGFGLVGLANFLQVSMV